MKAVQSNENVTIQELLEKMIAKKTKKIQFYFLKKTCVNDIRQNFS